MAISEEEAHLRNSATFRSLSMEMRVTTALAKRGWSTAQGAYYRDPVTDKERELDVDAVRAWRRGAQFVRLHLLVECKSIVQGRALFSDAGSAVEDDSTFVQWLDPDDDATGALLYGTLIDQGLETPAVRRLRKQFTSIAYPNGEASVAGLRVAPPKAPHRASSGREVKGDGRDERNFLWDAMQAVFATIVGTTVELAGAMLEEIRDRLAVAGGPQGQYQAALEAFEDAITVITLFHPVIVTDAQLLGLTHDDTIVPLRWCRLEQSRISTRLNRWIDIVHIDALDDYATLVTDWYSEAYAAAECSEEKRIVEEV